MLSEQARAGRGRERPQPLPPPRAEPLLPSVPVGRVPFEGGGLVPRVCDEVLWLAAGPGLAEIAAPEAGLSALGGW